MVNINYVSVDDPRFGIVVYKTGLDASFARRLDVLLEGSSHPYFKWNEALVGYSQKPDPNYRKCWDCKLGAGHLADMPADLAELYFGYASLVKACVDHYCGPRQIQMNYMEAVNFVKYNPGEHFASHADDGDTYSATVSTVGYLNDDYEGGELEFTKLGIKLKPELGDIVVFPSNFIYMHASLAVRSGQKFSAVTMFDHNDKWHGYHSEKPPAQPTFHGSFNYGS